MKKIALFLLITYANVFFSQSSNQIENDCWENVSEYDTLVLSNKHYTIIIPTDSSEFKRILSRKNKYNAIDKNIEVNNLFIKCTYRNGKSEIFKNNFKKGFDTYVKYKFYGTIETIDYYVFRIEYYENSVFLLVDKENGAKITLLSEPIFSDNNKYMACGNSTCAGDGGGLNIYEVKNNGKISLIGSEVKHHNWDPSKLKWNSNNELLIQKDRNCYDCLNKKYGKLILK